MGKALNILLGSVATSLIAVGVAAQTGTIRLLNPSAPPGSGAVQAQQAANSPSPSPEITPSPSTAPSAAPAAAVAPPPQEAPPKHGKKH